MRHLEALRDISSSRSTFRDSCEFKFGKRDFAFYLAVIDVCRVLARHLPGRLLLFASLESRENGRETVLKAAWAISLEIYLTEKYGSVVTVGEEEEEKGKTEGLVSQYPLMKNIRALPLYL